VPSTRMAGLVLEDWPEPLVPEPLLVPFMIPK
jgi:hypothetical protein